MFLPSAPIVVLVGSEQAYPRVSLGLLLVIRRRIQMKRQAFLTLDNMRRSVRTWFCLVRFLLFFEFSICLAIRIARDRFASDSQAEPIMPNLERIRSIFFPTDNDIQCT